MVAARRHWRSYGEARCAAWQRLTWALRHLRPRPRRRLTPLPRTQLFPHRARRRLAHQQRVWVQRRRLRRRLGWLGAMRAGGLSGRLGCSLCNARHAERPQIYGAA
jgi:hypothetical protein